MRQAPSIMTALGLFGTFYGLTDALRTFGTEIEQIQTFVGELKSVFVYSIVGIASAALFMMLNVVVNAIYHHRAQAEKNRLLAQQQQQNKSIQNNNEAVLQYLAAQLNALNQLNKTLQNQPVPLNTTNAFSGSLNVNTSAETQQFLQKQAEFAPYLVELANIQETLTKMVSKLMIPYTNHSAEWQEQMVSVFQEKLEVQTQILLQISAQLTTQYDGLQKMVATQSVQSAPASVGQKSVSTIANPLDSFRKLERELAELSGKNKLSN